MFRVGNNNLTPQIPSNKAGKKECGGVGGANEARRPQIMKKTPMSLWKRMKRERRRKT